jgi:hypothetical protein
MTVALKALQAACLERTGGQCSDLLGSAFLPFFYLALNHGKQRVRSEAPC